MNKSKQVTQKPVARKKPASGRVTGPSNEPMMNEWYSIWLRAVALAWQNPEFEKLLKSDPRKGLKQEFDYDLPEGIDLKVVDSASKRDVEGKLNKAELELLLPPKPKDIGDHAVALAELVDKHGRGNCCGQPCC
jgi:ribosomally synthesized peptide (two-chain TOMM family)